MCLVVVVSAPMLTTMLRSEPITGTVVSLQGTANLDPVVDIPTSLSGAWVRNAQILNTTANTTTTLTFNPLSSRDNGVYWYRVNVTPHDSTYVMHNSNGISFSLTVRQYLSPPPLEVGTDILSGTCSERGTTLLSNIILLANTHPSHILTYMWTDPNGHGITESSDNFTLMGSELRVNNLEGNTGQYELQVCLTIPGTDVVEHCSDTITYTISTEGNT